MSRTKIAAKRKKNKFPNAYHIWKNENIVKLRANSTIYYPTHESSAFPEIYKDIWNNLEDKSEWHAKEVAATPKWPMSAYYIWCKELMKKENSVFNVDFEKKAKILWNELEDKSEWKKKAILDEIRYEYFMHIWCGPSKPCAYKIWYQENKTELRLQARKIHNPALAKFQENAQELWNGLVDKSEWETKAALEYFSR